MAHMIATTARNTAAMAFVGQTPWHGLGQRLTAGAPLTVWTKEAGFDWEALSAVPMFTRADGVTVPYGDKQVIYRSDTGAPLSVMGKGYKIVQPRECIDFFQSLISGHGMQLETAGILDGGRRMWALAKNGHGGEIVKGDTVHQYLMLATSLDGTTPTTATFCATRVVCANTIAIALREAAKNIGKDREAGKGRGKKSAVRVSHRSIFSADDVKEQMGIADDAWRQFSTDCAMLAEKGCSMDQARDILRGVFGQPLQRVKAAQAPAAPAAQPVAAAPAPAALAAAGDTLAALLNMPHVPKVDPDREARETLAGLLAGGDAREQKSVARCLELFAGAGRGADHEGVKGTMWGLLNAVTEHVDHEQGRTTDTRLQSAWFGRGAQFKQSAYDAMLTA